MDALQPHTVMAKSETLPDETCMNLPAITALVDATAGIILLTTPKIRNEVSSVICEDS